MAQLNRRARHRRKRRWVKGILEDPQLSYEEKVTLLWLSQYADENGVITNPAVNAMIHEAVTGEGEEDLGSAQRC
ncbi:hypothetical protein F7P69_01420 [Cellulosimicrobium funkei]|nr:hypothetical protein [Cellulosimicrobium funkei]